MRGMMLETVRPVYDELLSAVHDAARRGAAPGTAICLQVSQRVARLPGILEHLRRIPNTRVVELPAGAAALALPVLWCELTDGRRTCGASFFSSRPWIAATPSAAAEQTASSPRPTHLLYPEPGLPPDRHPAHGRNAVDGRRPRHSHRGGCRQHRSEALHRPVPG